jgi:hypothetical protein
VGKTVAAASAESVHVVLICCKGVLPKSLLHVSGLNSAESRAWAQLSQNRCGRSSLVNNPGQDPFSPMSSVQRVEDESRLVRNRVSADANLGTARLAKIPTARHTAVPK